MSKSFEYIPTKGKRRIINHDKHQYPKTMFQLGKGGHYLEALGYSGNSPFNPNPNYIPKLPVYADRPFRQTKSKSLPIKQDRGKRATSVQNNYSQILYYTPNNRKTPGVWEENGNTARGENENLQYNKHHYTPNEHKITGIQELFSNAQVEQKSKARNYLRKKSINESERERQYMMMKNYNHELLNKQVSKPKSPYYGRTGQLQNIYVRATTPVKEAKNMSSIYNQYIYNSYNKEDNPSDSDLKARNDAELRSYSVKIGQSKPKQKYTNYRFEYPYLNRIPFSPPVENKNDSEIVANNNFRNKLRIEIDRQKLLQNRINIERQKRSIVEMKIDNLDSERRKEEEDREMLKAQNINIEEKMNTINILPIYELNERKKKEKGRSFKQGERLKRVNKIYSERKLSIEKPSVKTQTVSMIEENIDDLLNREPEEEVEIEEEEEEDDRSNVVEAEDRLNNFVRNRVTNFKNEIMRKQENMFNCISQLSNRISKSNELGSKLSKQSVIIQPNKSTLQKKYNNNISTNNRKYYLMDEIDSGLSSNYLYLPKLPTNYNKFTENVMKQNQNSQHKKPNKYLRIKNHTQL